VKRRSQLQAKATIILRKSIEDEGAWTAQQETYCSPEVEDAQQAARDQKGRKRATTLANGKMLSDTSSHCDDTDSSVSYDSLPRGSTSSTSKRRRHRRSSPSASPASSLSAFSLADSGISLPSIEENRPLRDHRMLSLVNNGLLTPNAELLETIGQYARPAGSEVTVEHDIGAMTRNSCA